MVVKKPNIFRVGPALWEEFGIFPSALGQREDNHRVRQDTEKVLIKAGTGNLGMLCEHFKIAVQDTVDKSRFVAALQGAFQNNLLTHAIEFQKKRAREIDQVFQRVIKNKPAFYQRVSSLASNPNETLRPLSKVLILLNESEAYLKEVFYLASWHSRDTSYRFQQEVHTPNRFCELIIEKVDKLTEMLVQCSDQGGELLGYHEIAGQTMVLVYLRKYRPKVSRDYKSKLNLHHYCGTLVLGLTFSDGCIHVKSTSNDVASTVQRFLEQELSLEVTRLEDKVENEFNPAPLNELIRGIHPGSSKARLVSIAFKRAAIGGVPITIPYSPFNDSILKTLEALSGSSIVALASPVNIAAMEVEYNQQIIKIETQLTSGGALRFHYQNIGITDSDQRSFEHEFLTTWGVPLNRLLNPDRWQLGSVGIIASILKAKTVEDIEDYQKIAYEHLKDIGIVEENEVSIWRCVNFHCASPPIREFDDHPCNSCGAAMRKHTIHEVKSSTKAMEGWVRSFLKTQLQWQLQSKQASFEARQFYPLVGDEHVGQRLAAFFQHSLSNETLASFDRSGLPVVRFSENVLDPPIRTERDDSVAISVPHLLATTLDDTTLPEIVAATKNNLIGMAASYDSRMSRAARISADRLEQSPVDQDGDRYEVDVFNVMQWLFWYSSRLGRKGTREPDGFVSFQVPDRDDRALTTWNVGYDAKFSKLPAGYSFGSEEQRQAFEYISKYFRANRSGKSSKLRIRGHVIISNNITSEKIYAFVNYLKQEGLIVAGKQSPIVALIRDEFLLKLYRSLSGRQDIFRKKRLHVHSLMVEALQQVVPHGFVEFGSSAADFILAEIENREPIEDGLGIDEFDSSFGFEFPANIFTPQIDLSKFQSASANATAD